MLALLAFGAGKILAADTGSGPAPEAAVAAAGAAAKAGEHHGLTPNAVKLPGLPITNSMIVTWVVALLIILRARRATRQIQAVPAGPQNFWEWAVETLHDFLGGILGPDLVKKTFWFFATIFIFILSANYFGLLPGVGTIGWGADTGHGFQVHKPLLRGANADLNMTLAMAMVFFLMWTIWAFQANGAKGFFLHLFGPKGETTGPLKVLMMAVFFFAGLIEVASILLRPVSLSFRLYGNIFAGENMLEMMTGLVPWLGWLIPLPFYFLELIVGLAQALVFMLLTAVFTLIICQPEEGHEAEHS